jgi:short-subunit dehydrogenase
MEIQNKKIVVTGAASGIGKALVSRLCEFDCEILAVDRNENDLMTTIQNLKYSLAKVSPYVCDLAVPENLDELFNHAIQALQGIDIFIANAGYAYYEQILQEDWQHIDQIFKVNVFSPLYSAIKMKNLFKENQYKVVITASAIGKLGLPGYALYGATKAAIDRFAEAYRFELDDPKKLALVYPIATRTNFFKEASTHKAPTPWPSQTPDQVAKTIIRGIERDQKSIFPSLTYKIFLALGKLIPSLFHLEQEIELKRFKAWIEENRKS